MFAKKSKAGYVALVMRNASKQSAFCSIVISAEVIQRLAMVSMSCVSQQVLSTVQR